MSPRGCCDVHSGPGSRARQGRSDRGVLPAGDRRRCGGAAFGVAGRSAVINPVTSVAILATLGLVGSALTFGLIRPWGEVFPRWIPLLRGRRVPILLAFVPAVAVAILVTSAGLMMTRILLAHPTAANCGDGSCDALAV